jgi:hypothetical protein
MNRAPSWWVKGRTSGRPGRHRRSERRPDTVAELAARLISELAELERIIPRT